MVKGRPDFMVPTTMPGIGTRVSSGVVSLPHNTITAVLAVNGEGTLLQATLEFMCINPPSASVIYELAILIDGASAIYVRQRQITQSVTATSGACSLGEFYTDGVTTTYLFVRIPLKFKTQIKLYAFQSTGAAVDCFGRLTLNLLG